MPHTVPADLARSPVLSRRRWGQWLAAALGAGAWPLSSLWAKSGADVLLAKNALPGVKPAVYLVSEKLDGVRAIWDGKELRFRSGRPVAAPAWFLAKLPHMALDGELWLARAKFDVLSGTVRKNQPIDAEWQQVQYMVFEQPGGEGDFATRYTRLRLAAQSANWPQLQALEQFRLATTAQLKDRLAKVVAAGGEGLMLHLSNASYVTGRSDVLLKYKPLADAEAEVIAHLAGKGKYAGQMGALEVRAEDGMLFKLGTGFSDEQRKSPPPVGSRVTYTYRDVTPNGKPRFASFLRLAAPD